MPYEAVSFGFSSSYHPVHSRFLGLGRVHHHDDFCGEQDDNLHYLLFQWGLYADLHIAERRETDDYEGGVFLFVGFCHWLC